MINIVYDAKLKRPGCVLLQASYGCSSGLAHKFPLDSWLVAPTPDLKKYQVTEEQLEKLVAITKDNHEQSRVR